MRNLIGVDPRNGAVAVAERIRVGQNVQFQLREADASRQEARQLLCDARDRCGEEPQFGLLFACLGRGQGLYRCPDGDVHRPIGDPGSSDRWSLLQRRSGPPRRQHPLARLYRLLGPSAPCPLAISPG